jgi:hypothetical protein
MIDAIDIFRAAKLVIDRHGEEAALYAAARTAVLAGAGDLWWQVPKSTIDAGLSHRDFGHGADTAALLSAGFPPNQ